LEPGSSWREELFHVTVPGQKGVFPLVVESSSSSFLNWRAQFKYFVPVTKYLYNALSSAEGKEWEL